MKVLIVGGGVAGLTLGAFLNGSAVEYEIVEKCPNWSHQGYLVAVWDNGRDIVKKLGFADAFDAAGSRVEYTSIRDGKGNLLRKHSFSDLYSSYGGATTVVNRADLHALLLSKNDPRKIRMGVSVTDIEQGADGVSVIFSTGETRKYDAVIGADGVHSFVRTSVFGKNTERYTGWRAWYGWIPHPLDREDTILECVEPRELIVVFNVKGKSTATFFAPANHATWDTPEGRIKRLKELFKDAGAVVPEILGTLKDDAFMPTDLFDVSIPSWVKKDTILIGDAAHSFGPITGMGCSMAMEDGYVLAANLLKVPEKQTLTQALKRYQLKQQKRVALVKRMTLINRPVLMVKSKLVRKALNIVAWFLPEHMSSGRNLQSLLKEEI